jgi:hypothetical protein
MTLFLFKIVTKSLNSDCQQYQHKNEELPLTSNQRTQKDHDI